MNFTHGIWESSEKLEAKNLSEDILNFENAMYRSLHERTNITVSFSEDVEFAE